MTPWLNWSGPGWYQQLSFSTDNVIWAQVSSNKGANPEGGWRWFDSESSAKLSLGITEKPKGKRGDLY